MVKFLLYMIMTNFLNGNDSELVELKFCISQDEGIYEESIYGEPPQFAIWIENVETNELETVFVTESVGKNEFEGRSEVLVALPIWFSSFHRESKLNSIDAVTGPTPQFKNVEIKKEVVIGSKWNYYIEVNVAGDYNSDFPLYQENGTMDAYGNGQPSIVYSGTISALPGEESKPLLIGRSEQLYYDNIVQKELEGIKSARLVFSKINVVCIKN